MCREGEVTTFIDRVIRRHGDRVKMERGGLYLDGVLVEPDHHFVLGNNRDGSHDSHFPSFGTIPLTAIADKTSIIWISRDWRRIGKRLQPNP